MIIYQTCNLVDARRGKLLIFACFNWKVSCRLYRSTFILIKNVCIFLIETN